MAQPDVFLLQAGSTLSSIVLRETHADFFVYAECTAIRRSPITKLVRMVSTPVLLLPDACTANSQRRSYFLLPSLKITMWSGGVLPFASFQTSRSTEVDRSATTIRIENDDW